jgi:hypothetical protein
MTKKYTLNQIVENNQVGVWKTVKKFDGNKHLFLLTVSGYSTGTCGLSVPVIVLSYDPEYQELTGIYLEEWNDNNEDLLLIPHLEPLTISKVV